MHQHSDKKILLLGNPNVGKSVIFNLLTGKHVTISNYPGTTVEIAQGTTKFDKNKVILDTPGINSLAALSEDEQVSRDIILKESFDAVIQVADAKNLRRALLISLQLIELEIPFILNLNMEDEAKSRRIEIDDKKLSQILNLAIIRTIAIEKKGINQLISKLKEFLERSRKPSFEFSYSSEIEKGIEKINKLLPEEITNVSKRGLALLLLSGDGSLEKQLKKKGISEEKLIEVGKVREKLEEKYSWPLRYIINQQRLKKIDQILEEVEGREETKKSFLSEKLGKISMHPVYGIPILLFILFLMYKFVGELGAQTLVDFFENVLFGEYFNPFVKSVVESTIKIRIIQDFLVGDYGLITMALTYAFAIILPIVTTFFLFFGFLEDSGYLPRLGIMTNKIFNVIGLNGKAVLPMILGLGCDTMATLTTRTLDTKRERIIVTLLLALAVPCSAQLGVILGLLGSISAQVLYIWVLAIILVLLLVGYLASKIIPGERSDFIVEIPPLRTPKLSNILVKTLSRLEWYIREAVPLFILGTMVLFAFDKIGWLKVIETFVSPLVVGFLGLPLETTRAFIVGFLRRDYGAAGLFVLAQEGLLSPVQILVAMTTITLFVPCIANFFVIIKERGMKTALAMVAFIFPFAFLVGGLLNFILRFFEVNL